MVSIKKIKSEKFVILGWRDTLRPLLFFFNHKRCNKNALPFASKNYVLDLIDKKKKNLEFINYECNWLHQKSAPFHVSPFLSHCRLQGLQNVLVCSVILLQLYEKVRPLNAAHFLIQGHRLNFWIHLCAEPGNLLFPSLSFSGGHSL